MNAEARIAPLRDPANGLSWGRVEIAVLGNLGPALLLAAFFIMVAEAIMRNLLWDSFPWSEEAVRLLTLWAVFLSLAVAGRQGRHIRMELVYKALQPWAQRWLDGFSALCGLTYAGLGAYGGAVQVTILARSGTLTESLWDLPMWLAFAVVPLGFGLLLIFYAESLIMALRGRGPKEKR